MNCKPGDLAIIVNDPCEGRVVSVDSFIGLVRGSIDSGPHWIVSATWEMDLGHKMSTIFIFPDSRLRPISGVPVADGVEDEVTA